MDNIIPTNEYTEFENRAYINPQVSLDESNAFIDNLRATQGKQNQEIISDTQMLGTDVPSNLGGLTGTNSYFTSRYQTPQTNSAVANLRATAQAAALNQILANQQDMWKKRYNDAYRSYQKRSGGGSGGSGGSSGGSDGGNSSNWQGDTVDKATDLSAGEYIRLDSNSPGDFGEGVTWTVNPATVGQELLEFIRVDTTKPRNDPERETYYRQKSKDDKTLIRVR